MDDDKILDLRIVGVRESSGRTRAAFFIMVFACGTILVTLYNNYFVWSRIFLDPSRGLMEWPVPTDPASGVRDPSPPSALSGEKLNGWRARLEESKKKRTELADRLGEELRKQDVRSVSENEGISIPLLGIKLSSGDLDIFGCIVLLFASMYYLLCVRRMSQEVLSLLQDARRLGGDARRFVYVGVRQSFVLNAATEETAGSIEPGETWIDRCVTISSRLFQNLAYLPTITIGALVASDWYLVIRNGSWWLTHLSPEYRNQFLLMDAFAVLVGCATMMLNRSTKALQRKAVAQLNTFPLVVDAAHPVSDSGDSSALAVAR
jgi:hypothetical protein